MCEHWTRTVHSNVLTKTYILAEFEHDDRDHLHKHCLWDWPQDGVCQCQPPPQSPWEQQPAHPPNRHCSAGPSDPLVASSGADKGGNLIKSGIFCSMLVTIVSFSIIAGSPGSEWCQYNSGCGGMIIIVPSCQNRLWVCYYWSTFRLLAWSRRNCGFPPCEYIRQARTLFKATTISDLHTSCIILYTTKPAALEIATPAMVPPFLSEIAVKSASTHVGNLKPFKHKTLGKHCRWKQSKVKANFLLKRKK